MFKYLIPILPFLKELFIEKKEELEFNSPYFNIKKWLQIALVLVSMGIALTVTDRLIRLTMKYLALQKDYNEILNKLDTLKRDCHVDLACSKDNLKK